MTTENLHLPSACPLNYRPIYPSSLPPHPQPTNMTILLQWLGVAVAQARPPVPLPPPSHSQPVLLSRGCSGSCLHTGAQGLKETERCCACLKCVRAYSQPHSQVLHNCVFLRSGLMEMPRNGIAGCTAASSPTADGVLSWGVSHGWDLGLTSPHLFSSKKWYWGAGELGGNHHVQVASW